jgi:hypothetical protein
MAACFVGQYRLIGNGLLAGIFYSLDIHTFILKTSDLISRYNHYILYADEETDAHSRVLNLLLRY